MRAEFCQLLLMLRHLLDHLRQISHVLAVAPDVLLLVELLQFLGHVLGHHCDMLEQRDSKFRLTIKCSQLWK